MHELSVVDGILRVVEIQKRKHRFSRVKLIEIICGKYNCLSEDNLQFCFDAATESSSLKGARLKIVRRGEDYRCAACNAEFGAESESLPTCPACRSTDVIPRMDYAVYVRSLEVE
ncbi:MAG: hydrogenase maturation nickel metallochaperone HypA [Candidatus Aureabacteria bacterium]|nr:hydrogenase maturation nickel metallochaperone HypA [Candidatus Auribacterota bacterium]